MFSQPMPGTSSGISRPFIAGLLMLLFFLSLQTEWTPAKQGREGRSLTMQAAPPTASEAREAMKEKIILDLSLSNEKLERENTRLKQHVLDLRRAARGCGCDLNATEAAAATAYPELGRLLGTAAEAEALPVAQARVPVPPAPAPQPVQTHRSERHRHHIPAGQDPGRRRAHRYSDFLVNEIDGNGNVVQLNSTAVSTSERAPSPAAPAPACSERGNIEPNTAPEAAVVAPEAPPHASADVTAPPGYAQFLSGLDKLLPSEGVAAVQQFLTAVEAYERSWADADAPSDADAPAEKLSSAERVKPPLPITFAVSSNKDERTAVHHFFKQPGLPKCSTETMPAGENGENCMRLCYHAQRRKRKREAANGVGSGKATRSGGNSEQVFLPGGPKYCRFALCKENMDSGHALSLLARAVHCSPSCFGVAGTKDKRAVTVQQVTAFKVAPSRLASSNGRLRGMRVGDFELVDEPLHLGDAKGNRFEVTLRDVGAGSLHDVVAAVEAVREDGFINYFGLQRFGSTGGRTHRIGALLLKGEWKAAVDMILGRIEGERSDNDEARRLYLEEGDVSGALKLMQRHLTAERALLEALRKQKGANFCQALQQIPRNTRTMYVHAYQSRLWNEAASHRVHTFGAKDAVAGDLVVPPDAAEAAPEEEAEEADKQLPQQPERGRLPAEAHVVTEEEAASALYSIDDVVLPLPGCRVQYPRHATAQVYTDLATKDGIPLDSAPHGVRDFSLTALPGGYRRLLHRPRDLNWRLLRYSDPDAPLALSTLDRLTGAAPPAVNVIGPDEEVGAGEKIALQLAFSLPSSTYATMVVRELTKTSTATAFHKSLSQLAK